MANLSPSSRLADSLAALSRTACQAFMDLETQSRSEVKRAISESREAHRLREEAIKELHDSQLDAQRWKQEATVCKAALTQAESINVHHTETITQLKRELKKAEDQARNWQDHFTRVEQARCALVSRVDELSERLQWRQQQRREFDPETVTSTSEDSPISLNKQRPRRSSQNQPPAYKSIIHSNPTPAESPIHPKQNEHSLAPGKKTRDSLPINNGNPLSDRLQRKPSRAVKQNQKSQDVDIPKDTTETKTQEDPNVTNNSPSTTCISSSIVRHVKVVINVKQEEESETEELNEAVKPPKKPKTSRRNRQILDDDDYSDSHPQDSDKNDDDDELMMGAEENHREVYGTYSVDASPKKRPKSSVAGTRATSTAKKRKVDSSK